MTVPDEAVEAAAREAATDMGIQWDDLSESVKNLTRERLRKAFEAAAPFIAAQAWDAGWNAGLRFESPKNPYRSKQ